MIFQSYNISHMFSRNKFQDYLQREIWILLLSQDHQTSMVEVQGMIQNQFVSIMIDSGASLSYVSPSIVEKCSLSLKKY